MGGATPGENKVKIHKIKKKKKFKATPFYLPREPFDFHKTPFLPGKSWLFQNGNRVTILRGNTGFCLFNPF